MKDGRPASMRPPEFTGGNWTAPAERIPSGTASMRPPEFTGGNRSIAACAPTGIAAASMRPPEFTGGNVRTEIKPIAPAKLLQ